MDAVAEIQMFASRSYEWVLEGDITACFDEIDHTALMGRVRRRIGDKRVLALVKAFLKAGVLSEDQVHPGARTPAPRKAASSPRCWPTSPWRCSTSTSPELWADHQRHPGRPFPPTPPRASRSTASCGTPTTSWSWCPAPGNTPRRCASQVAAVLAPMGLRLSPEKTTVVHIDEGFDFLGFRIQRHQKPGTTTAIRLHLPGQEVAGFDQTAR